MTSRVRKLIAEKNLLAIPLDSLGDTDDLYDAGMTSFGSVTLMLALEETFDVEFPERMLQRRTFATIAAIDAAIAELTEMAA